MLYTGLKWIGYIVCNARYCIVGMSNLPAGDSYIFNSMFAKSKNDCSIQLISRIYDFEDQV